MTALGRRQLTVLAAVVAVVIVGAVIAAFQLPSEQDPVDEALSLLGNEKRFDSSREAVENFAGVYQKLVDATAAFPKSCDVRVGQGRCLALNQAAAWSLSFAPASGHCTQPAVQDGRIALRDYVRQAGALADATTEPPPLPPIPAC